jgi:hypothetical protein
MSRSVREHRGYTIWSGLVVEASKLLTNDFKVWASKPRWSFGGKLRWHVAL